MKVFIQSRPLTYSAYNLHNMRDPDTGVLLNKSKYGLSKDGLMALYSGKVGGLKNGLSYKPWLDDNGVQKKDKDGKNLTLQDREEDRWGKPKGFLTNKSWRIGDTLNPADRPYFQKKYWKLNDGTTVLNVDTNFEDAMFYYVALDSKYIANSLRELNEGKWPEATHFIAITNENEEIAFSRNKKKIKAYAALESKVLTSAWKLRFIHILELSSVTNALSEEQIENTLFNFLSADSGRPGNNIDKFMNMYIKLKDAEGRKELEAQLMLRKALESRVVYEKSDTYTWNRTKGPIVIGDRYEDAISFIINPAKETLVEELQQEINSKLI